MCAWGCVHTDKSVNRIIMCFPFCKIECVLYWYMCVCACLPMCVVTFDYIDIFVISVVYANLRIIKYTYM